MRMLPQSGLSAVALGVALLGAAVIGSELFDGGDHMSPCVIYAPNVTPEGQYDGSTCLQRRQEVHGRSLLFLK